MVPSGLLTVHRVAQASSTAIVLLILANLTPLAGVLFLGWDLFTLLVLYWLENGVIGAYAIGRAMTAAGVAPPGKQAMDLWEVDGAGRQIGTVAGLSPDGRVPVRWVRQVRIFALHFGGFWMIHGFVLFQLAPLLRWAGGTSGRLDLIALAIAGTLLVISHGASFRLDWLGAGEYRTSTPAAELTAPYVRIVVLHLAIIFGGFAVVVLWSQIWILAVLVALKTAVDLAAHLGERGRAAARALTSGSGIESSA